MPLNADQEARYQALLTKSQGGTSKLSSDQEARYQELMAKQNSSKSQDQYSTEAHPDFQLSEGNLKGPMVRFNAKNLANNPQEMADYVHKSMPEFATKVLNGNVYVKKQGENTFHPLDPSSWQGIGEAVQDVGDALSDVGQGAAATGGAILGSAAGPAGTIAGGGLGAGGFEALRQGLGKVAGVNQGADLGKMGTATAVGAALPAVGQVLGLVPKVATGFLPTPLKVLYKTQNLDQYISPGMLPDWLNFLLKAAPQAAASTIEKVK